MRMLRQGLARLEEHLYSSRTPGAPKCCHHTQWYACLTPMWSLYYCMEQRHGGQLTPPPGNYRPLLITVSNSDLWEKTHQQNAGDEIWRRRWGWIGHTLRKPASTITGQALTWNPEGKRKRGHPWNMCWRDLLTDINRTGYSWRELEKKAQDRRLWKTVVNDLMSQEGAKDEEEEIDIISKRVLMSILALVVEFGLYMTPRIVCVFFFLQIVI